MESNKDLSAFCAITDYECPAVQSLRDSIVCNSLDMCSHD